MRLVATEYLSLDGVLGRGMRLFDDDAARRPLDLKETKRFKSGIVILELEPARA